MIKYTDAQITFREVPNEVSLSINISNCPYKCKGCHSPYLQKNIGKELTAEVLNELIEKYKDQITCVTFLGDGGNIEELSKLIEFCWERDYFTCLYTGANNESLERIIDVCNGCLDFIKTGPYIEEKGGLDSPTTNQRFYKVNYIVNKDDTITTDMVDMTEKFLKIY